MKRAGRLVALVGIVVVYLVLFSWGAQLLPADLRARSGEGPALTSTLALLGIAVFDVALLAVVASTSRLGGLRLWLLLVGTFYGVKTFTSQLETAFFMQNVPPSLLPALFAMTLPLAFGVPALLVLLLGRRPTPTDAWQTPAMSRAERWGKVLALGALLYPALFFGFGYAVAWQSPAVRSFYGGDGGGGFFAQLGRTIDAHPAVLPFEALRGLLWVALALPILRTTRGRWWLGGLWVALAFSLVQNDVHLLPNPLMPAAVRRMHFLETASSNFIFGWAVAWTMSRRWRHPVAGSVGLVEATGSRAG